MTGAIRTKAEAALARCDALGVEATRIFLSLDRARVLHEADALDARTASGESLPLAGVLCSIKDLIDRRAEVTTAGSILLEARAAAQHDALVVSRLEAAGALIVGRTNLTEFAYSGLGINPHHGTPGAIYDRQRVPGGSSCGAALSVAHGIVDAAIGTDTGGSVRIPAAVNGLYGYKPTASSVPTDGVHPLSHDMDSVGPLAASLDVLERVAAVLRDRPFDAVDEIELDGVRLGRPLGPMIDGLDAAVQAHYDRVLQALASRGAILVDVDLDWLAETALANKTLVACEALDRYADAIDTLERVGDPDVLRRMRFAEQVTPDERRKALQLRQTAIERFSDTLTDANVGVLVSPTLRVVPPTIADARAAFDAHNAAMLVICANINFVDGCAITLPHGAPPGAWMLSSTAGADDRLMRLARAIERSSL